MGTRDLVSYSRWMSYHAESVFQQLDCMLMQATGRYWRSRCVTVKTFKTAGCSDRRGRQSHGDTSYVWAAARMSERTEHLTLIKYTAADACVAAPCLDDYRDVPGASQTDYFVTITFRRR